MNMLKNLLGDSKPLSQTQYEQNNALYKQQMAQQIGMQQAVAGGGMSGLAISAASVNSSWGQGLSPIQIREKTRRHIADQVTKMAEEVGAPTLLHAVALAISTMDIPE